MPQPVAQTLEWLSSTVFGPPSFQKEVMQWRGEAKDECYPHPHPHPSPYPYPNSDVDRAEADILRAHAQGRRELHISRLPASSLPSAIGRLTALQYLTVSETGCTELPASICNLANLRRLSLTNNPQLTCLPDRIGNLRQLTSLHVADSPLEDLPESLGSLSNLEELSLSGGEYEDLPASLGRLKALKRLTIGHNPELQYLPDNLGELSNLRELDVADCRNLADLPWSLRWLPTTCTIRVPLHLKGRLAELRENKNGLLKELLNRLIDGFVWLRLH